jgi:hypothetical protein
MLDVSDVRSELQLPTSVISDSDIQYAITLIALNDINLVCAKVLGMVIAKYRGRIRYKIGSYTEWVDVKALRALMRSYIEKSPNLSISDLFDADDDEDDNPDAFFTREGI